MRVFGCVILLLIMLTAPVSAQLTPDQEALMESVRLAYSTSADWQSYQLAQQITTNGALTVYGTDVLIWQTSNTQTDIAAEIDLANEMAQGEIFQTGNRASADEVAAPQDQRIAFAAIDGLVFIDAQDGEGLTEVTDTLIDYSAYGLPAVVTFGKPPTINDWLDNTLAVYDLGVVDGVQGYQMEFALTDSLPYIDFNLDAFLNEYNGLVELGALGEAISEVGSVTLVINVDVESNQILNTSELIQIAVEISGEDVVSVPAGDGVFQLDYAHQIDTQYSALGIEFEVEMPGF